MAEPQAVISRPARATVFLVVTVTPGHEDTVRGLLEDVSGLRRSVAFRAPGDELGCIVGIGSAVWDRLFGGPRPQELHPFVELTGKRHRAPSTPGDLLFHLRAQRMDLCFELARLIVERLDGAVTVVDEVHGFKYFDERDLLGFVDGSENPEGRPAAEAVIVGDEDPAFEGGSYVIIQKYLHDLRTWNALPSDEQEKVIGRTKLANVELPDDVKPADSHVALNTITDEDGGERKIVRENMPFGTLGEGEFGTFFIGYARTPEVTEQMLRNMFLGDGRAPHDRILDFSTAITGCLFHVPTVDFLDDLPAPPCERAADLPAGSDETAADLPAGSGEPAAADGSLGIGSLKGA
ncbi:MULTISPECIES: Dyp-type peroxidase [unclassified Streptomyces]|uniref:Dyp-type peroxidase n=1 Tax=unclassified Streptomyces TaxID=2593676 RepID=UPI00225C192C|nr:MULTISPECIES: Dyp-type peroxidase [unclassified Streptomyces]MCX4987673.1 Dyp-type peroxidase [Streptomyces sp. NBC_00568]MCX5007195.1 Dyp-type peroxidase [Streptomyces sp. NBC_00638]